MKRFLLITAAALICSCSNPQPGPDKTVGGAVLGAAWGAGAGAIVANQTGDTAGDGMLVGAGIGAVGGALSGYAYDENEDAIIAQEKQLASLKVQNMANGQQLAQIQGKLDRAISSGVVGNMYQVYFDNDATNLRAGSIADLEVIAETIKRSTSAYIINVVGHADDAGSPKYNERLAESRARAVSAYLASRGISIDQIVVKNFGSTRPIASNASEVGRQLNRRVDVFISSVK